MAKSEFSIEEIRNFQDLLLSAMSSDKRSEMDISKAAGIPQTSVNEYKRGPKPGMSFTTIVKLFSLYGISPNKVAAALGLWKEDEEVNQEVYVRMAALSRKSEEDRKKILWVLDALLKSAE